MFRLLRWRIPFGRWRILVGWLVLDLASPVADSFWRVDDFGLWMADPNGRLVLDLDARASFSFGRDDCFVCSWSRSVSQLCLVM